MVCGQIHAPATLPNYVHMHLMNKALRRQPTILENWYVYLAMLCNRGPFIAFSLYVSSVGDAHNIPRTKPCSFCQALLSTGTSKNGVFCSRIFLLCTPLKYDHTPNIATDTDIWHAVSQPKQTESLCDCHPRFDYEY